MNKYFAIALLAIFATYMLRTPVGSITYSDYKDTLSALLNISSIVFAIIGAWIAIIYPRAIGSAFKGVTTEPQLKDANNDANYLSELVETVLVSAVVLMLVLAIQFLVPIIKNSFPFGYPEVLKYIGFGLIGFMTLSQLYVVFRVILANYFFLNQLRRKNIKDKIDKLHK